MVKTKEATNLLILKDLQDELYDSTYSFESADMMDVLPVPRDYTIIPKCENLTKKWIKHFTLPIPDFVHYTGSFFFGTQGSGKTVFSEQMAMIMDEHYGDKLIILHSIDMQSMINFIEQMPYEEKDQKVFFLIIDDALIRQNKAAAAKQRIVEELSIIRRYIDGENDASRDKKKKMRGILYVDFNSQLLYFLDKNIRSMLKYRAFKSKSGSKHDNTHYFQPILGEALYKHLSKIDKSAENASNKLKHITVVDMNGEVGFIVLDNYDEKKLVEIRKKIIYLEPSMEIPIGGTPNKYSKIVNDSTLYTTNFLDFQNLLIYEMLKLANSGVKEAQLGSAEQIEKKMKIWFERNFKGTSPEKLQADYNLEISSYHQYLSNVNAFMKTSEGDDLKEELSESWTAKHLQEALNQILPLPLKVLQRCSVHKLPGSGEQFNDLCLHDSQESLLLAINVKWYQGRKSSYKVSCSPENKWRPCAILMIDTQLGKTAGTTVRFRVLEPTEGEKEKVKIKTITKIIAKEGKGNIFHSIAEQIVELVKKPEKSIRLKLEGTSRK